jgi:hypothetical protein
MATVALLPFLAESGSSRYVPCFSVKRVTLFNNCWLRRFRFGTHTEPKSNLS